MSEPRGKGRLEVHFSAQAAAYETNVGPLMFPEPEAFWEFFMVVGGPAAMVARLPQEQQTAFKADVLRALAAKRGPHGIPLRFEIVYGTGIRPR